MPPDFTPHHSPSSQISHPSAPRTCRLFKPHLFSALAAYSADRRHAPCNPHTHMHVHTHTHTSCFQKQGAAAHCAPGTQHTQCACNPVILHGCCLQEPSPFESALFLTSPNPDCGHFGSWNLHARAPDSTWQPCLPVCAIGLITPPATGTTPECMQAPLTRYAARAHPLCCGRPSRRTAWHAPPNTASLVIILLPCPLSIPCPRVGLPHTPHRPAHIHLHLPAHRPPAHRPAARGGPRSDRL